MTSLDTSGAGISMEEHEPSSIEARLRKVKLEVKKATQEALKNSNDHYHHHDTAESEHPHHPQLSSSRTSAAAEEKNDPNASFHLGMELFGQEASVMERNVQEQLLRIEKELQGVLEEVQQQQSGAAASLPENPKNPTKTPEEIRAESEHLRTKLRFLQECSSARAWLDESLTLSTPALAPNEEPQWVRAAQLAVQAEGALARAEAILEASFSTVTNAAADEAATEEEQQQQQQPPAAAVLAVAYTIVDAVRSSLRRQKVELVGKATVLWHTCVSLTHNHTALSVRTAPALSVAYDILETFGETATLEAMLRKFTRTLQQDVFQPLLLEAQESRAAAAAAAGAPKKAMKARTFHETEDRSSAGGSSSSSSHSAVAALTKGTVRRLEWTVVENEGDDNSILGASATEDAVVKSWGETLAFIQRIVVFVADHVLLQRIPLCNFVSLRLFGKPNALPNALNLEALGLESCRLGDDQGLLLHPLANAMEETCIPRYLKPSEMGQLQSRAKKLRNYLDPFLEVIASKNLLPLDGKTRLSTLPSTFEQKYVDYRRCVLLNEARDMLVNNDYHNTVQVGEDVHRNKEDEALGICDGMAVFKLHKSSVSNTAFKVMTMCRQIMDEAVEQQSAPELSPLSSLSATLYRTAREVLDLFRAIIPVTHGHAVANVPRTAAVLHNDCVFLAHHCLTLGLEYKDKFPEVAAADDARGKLLRQTCMFVDMVPLFRDLADRSLGDMLDAQAKQLTVLVGERVTLMGEALRSDEILAEWSDAETALEAGLYHLRHLSQAWKPILSYDILNRSMCYLVDVMFTLFLDQVAKASDISASACQFVHALFLKATHDVEALLDNGGDTSGSRVWGRFSAVGRFMDMSLADIQVALADTSMFRSVTGPELSRLVTSCFDDSPKRRALLKTLTAAGNQ